MCGIVGSVNFKGSSVDQENIIRRQLETMRFRGPDGESVLVRNNVAFGHARLSIIDLSTTASQPMTSSNGRFLITFNGEIYNYLELKDELAKVGIVFRTRSDTEVLLEGYAYWGESIVDKLNGMFAFAIFDFQEQKLFCARDPLGQKPFFFTQQQDAFHFASEPRVFRLLPKFQWTIQPGAIANYLTAEGFYGNQSIFSDVQKLLPGHTLTWHAGAVVTRCYFSSQPAAASTIRSEAEAIELVDKEIERSIRFAIRADVPVGLLLSGGLDSSLVLAYFRKILPTGKISAFHVEIDSPTFNESAYAKEAARATSVNLNIFKLGLSELGELAMKVPSLLDEPQADPGILPKFFVCREIAKSFKVALTGDGSDELFYGYLLFKGQKLAQYYRHVPNWVHKNIVVPIARNLPTTVGYMRTDFLAKQFIRGFPASDALRASYWMRAFTDDELYRLLQNRDDVGHDTSLTNKYLFSIWEESKNSRFIGQLAYRLQKTYLPDYVLCNSDRASMLNSLELRSPLLDPNLVRLANSLPDQFKMPGFNTKGLLKLVAERHLPRSLIYRKKIGFTVPMADILRTTLKQELYDVFASDRLQKQGIFNSTFITDLLERHFSGRENLYKPIWTLYSLQKWLMGQGF